MPDAYPDLGEIRFRKVRDAGGVINATFAFLRRNAREAFVGYLAIVGPVYLAVAILQALYFDRIQGLGADPDAVLEGLAGLVGPLVGLVVAGFAAGVVAQSAAAAYVLLYRQGAAGAITPSVLWEETRGLLGPIAGLTALVFAGAFGVTLLIIVPCLGAIAALVLFVWASPIVLVMTPARVLEEDSGLDAWARARLLVKGSWGAAFGTFFMVALILVVLSLVLSIPGLVLGAFAGLNEIETGAPSSPGLGVMLALTPLQVIGSLVYLVPLVAAFFLHGRLAEEQDGGALYDSLDAIAGETFEPRSAPTSTAPTDLAQEPPPAPESRPGPGGDRPDDAPPDADRGGFRGGGFGGA